MKKFFLLIGIVISVASVQTARAEMFDLFYAEAENAASNALPSPQVEVFIIEEMKKWNGHGIILSSDDIRAALAGNTDTVAVTGLCQNKTDLEGNPLTFLRGGAGVAGSCFTLLTDIRELLATEQEIRQLGADLLALTGGSELAIADEPHRPLDMASMARLIRTVWAGTGSAVIPWNSDADDDLAELNAHLTEENVDLAVYRFRHGTFRDERENDPRFIDPDHPIKTDVQDIIREDLRKIAEALGITGDPEAEGVFVTPKLAMNNVALWARRDDIGLLHIYPTHISPVDFRPAGEYPEYLPEGYLAYPFAYEGGSFPVGDGIDTPLCSRPIAQQGYLCRAQPVTPEQCPDNGSDDTISLVKCSEETTVTESGPTVCPAFGKLFKDTGIPLVDPENPGRLNPALEAVDLEKICFPETKVIYQDDITSHACYVAHCLLQSMSGHTLVPNRNPVVMNEASSPYLACIRPDPQLGLYTEIAEDTPYPLPEYLGQYLVRDFERQYCLTNGLAPLPLMGLCAYQDSSNAASPSYVHLFNALTTAAEGSDVAGRQSDYSAIAAAIGQRVAVDQSIELQRKVFARLANFIRHTAEMFGSLRQAPLTMSACPWTGPFRSSAP